MRLTEKEWGAYYIVMAILVSALVGWLVFTVLGFAGG